MIFLTVGTWYKGFDRLVRAVDEFAGCGIITDKVIAQIGYGSYKPRYLTVINFCSPSDFKELISTSDLLISHTGIGTIIEAIKQLKPVIVVPRRRDLGEASNDHQFVTARQLEAEGKVLAAYDVSELPDRLEAAKTFIPQQGQNGEAILSVVQKFIDEIMAKKCAEQN